VEPEISSPCAQHTVLRLLNQVKSFNPLFWCTFRHYLSAYIQVLGFLSFKVSDWSFTSVWHLSQKLIFAVCVCVCVEPRSHDWCTWQMHQYSCTVQVLVHNCHTVRTTVFIWPTFVMGQTSHMWGCFLWLRSHGLCSLPLVVNERYLLSICKSVVCLSVLYNQWWESEIKSRFDKLAIPGNWTSVKCLYKFNVPMIWQVTTGDNYLSNVPFLGYLQLLALCCQISQVLFLRTVYNTDCV
jgi:hypothetical protein